MIEAEESFIECINDITERIESVIKTVTNNLLDKHAKEINDAYVGNTAIENRIDDSQRFQWLQKPFQIITYSEASDIVRKHHNANFNSNDGLAKSDELFLVKHFDSPVFVINWPKSLKPFYMRTCKDDPNLVIIAESITWKSEINIFYSFY